MLLDLCDIVHDDTCYISSLGKLAMKFAYLLCIKLPEIDPGEVACIATENSDVLGSVPVVAVAVTVIQSPAPTAARGAIAWLVNNAVPVTLARSKAPR